MIVDTHVHVVTDDRARYPRLADTPRAGSIPTITEIGQTEWPLTTAEILIGELDRAGVAKATLVQSYFVYEYDNSYAIDSANAHPDRFVSIVTLDPTDPAAPDKLSAVVAQGAKGIRFMRGRLPRCTLGEPETLALWKRIEELQIPLCIHDKVEELVRLPAVLERFPDVTVAMDHGWGHKVGEPPYDLLNPLFALARFPNIRVKTAINNIEAARGTVSTPRIFYD
jgi:predicted TIM-barrel fold metal-dependent hydrolase